MQKIGLAGIASSIDRRGCQRGVVKEGGAGGGGLDLRALEVSTQGLLGLGYGDRGNGKKHDRYNDHAGRKVRERSVADAVKSPDGEASICWRNYITGERREAREKP